jgi:hypothetical protein
MTQRSDILRRVLMAEARTWAAVAVILILWWMLK